MGDGGVAGRLEPTLVEEARRHSEQPRVRPGQNESNCYYKGLVKLVQNSHGKFDRLGHDR